MTDDDPTATEPGKSLERALKGRLEIEFTLAGADVVMRPHVFYETASGSRNLRGFAPDGRSVEVPFAQVKNLVVTDRAFNIDPTFDWRDSRYYKVFAWAF
jgi:hypothetical protein